MTLKTYVYNHVRRAANKVGVDIVPYRPCPVENSLNILGFVIEHYLASRDSFNFVQVGANNGVLWDPLHEAIVAHHLAGLLVEPLPDVFEQLKANYSGESQLVFENAAIAEQNGTRTLYRVKPDADVPEYAHGLASFNRANLDLFKRFVQEVPVPTLTVSSLLQKHHIDHATLLQIDTEGYDYEIIKMFFHEGVFPDIINFEHVYLSGDENAECRNLLRDCGYTFTDVPPRDTLALRVDAGR
jgi:FkbM family methyltransferase